MGIVYAKESAAVQHTDGVPVMIARGAAYDDTHPIVKAVPDLFEAEPGRVAGRGGVERTTRAPGERRAPSAAEKRKAAAAKRKATNDAKKAAADKAKSDAAADAPPADAKADTADGAE